MLQNHFFGLSKIIGEAQPLILLNKTG